MVSDLCNNLLSWLVVRENILALTALSHSLLTWNTVLLTYCITTYYQNTWLLQHLVVLVVLMRTSMSHSYHERPWILLTWIKLSTSLWCTVYSMSTQISAPSGCHIYLLVRLLWTGNSVPVVRVSLPLKLASLILVSQYQIFSLTVWICESVVEMVVLIGAFFFKLILKYPQSNKKTQHYFEAPWITTAYNLCCFYRFWIHCFCEFHSLTTHHHKNLAFCVLLQLLRPCEVICMCMGCPRIGGGHTEVDHYLGHKCITPGLPLWTSWPFRKLGRTPTLTQLRLQQVNQPAYAASLDRATSHGGSN